VRGHLDLAAARSLRAAVDAALGAGGGDQRVTVDLSGVETWTTDGVHEVVRCAVLGEGVQFKLGRAAMAAG
jgi:hypothetical protein